MTLMISGVSKWADLKTAFEQFDTEEIKGKRSKFQKFQTKDKIDSVILHQLMYQFRSQLRSQF